MRGKGQKPSSEGRKNLRTYNGDLPPQIKLKEGDKFSGAFQSARETSIFDDETKKPKLVMVYNFTDKDGKPVAILGGLYSLDNSFRRVFDREGGITRCQGLMMEVRRTANSRVPRTDNIMFNFEIDVWEE